MMFRNLGKRLSSDLIRSAVRTTRTEWLNRYGEVPNLLIRTEIGIKNVRSRNPGYCYIKAGWTRDRTVRGKLYLYEPEQDSTHDI